jgi:hypothetical protein
MARSRPGPRRRRGISSAEERLGIEPDEMDGGHYISLSRPRELAERLSAYAADSSLGDDGREARSQTT